ncbi:ankyrin repeat domain-containing protein [Mycobacterium sp. NPDC051198]
MVDERDRAGRTALHYAAVDDKIDVLRGLIREGADINARDDAGWTPLHFAADRGNLEVAEELLRAGADVNETNKLGEGPLFRAVAVGAQRDARLLVELLLDNGADPYRKISSVLSPARFVSFMNENDPIKVLFVERGVQMS